MTDERVKEPIEIVVSFKTHLREGADEEEYGRTAGRMRALVSEVPGFISIRVPVG